MSPEERSLLDVWVRRRDPEAFTQVARRYAAMVYATCIRVLRNSADAEDVAQECFETLATLRKPPTSSLGAWLHAVATNKSLNRLKGEGRRVERETRFADSLPKSGITTWDDLYVHVDEAIAELPENLRGPIVAHFLNGETHDEIARAEGVSRSTITRRIERGVEQVREGLKRRGVEIASTALAAMLAENATATEASNALVASIGKLALAGPDVATGSWFAGGAMAVAGIVLAVTAVTLLASRNATRDTIVADAQVSKSEAVSDIVQDEVVATSPGLDSDSTREASADVDTGQIANAGLEENSSKETRATILGRVTNAAGEPVENTGVYLFSLTRTQTGDSLITKDQVTGPDGRYEFSDVEPALTCWISAEGDGISPQFEMKGLLAGDRCELDLVVFAGRIQGFVQEAGGLDSSRGVVVATLVEGSVDGKVGKGLSEAQGPVESVGGLMQGTPESEIGADGSFVFRQLAPGIYEFEVQMPGGSAWQTQKERYRLGPDQVLSGITIRATAPVVNAVISGRVTDDAGVPIGGVELTAYSRGEANDSTTSFDDGTYAVKGMAGNQHFIAAQHEKYERGYVEGIESGATGVDFTLPRRGGLEGGVTDALSGDPVTKFSFLDLGYSRDKRLGGPRGDTLFVESLDGSFTIAELLPQRIPLTVWAEGYAHTYMEVSVPPGDALRDVRVELRPERIVRGRVVDESGAPVVGAIVSEIQRRGPGGFRTESDADGNFELRRCQPDIEVVVASHHAFALATAPLETNSGEVTLVMNEGAKVNVRVSSEGALVTSSTVELKYSNGLSGPRSQPVPNGNGTVPLERVARGLEAEVRAFIRFENTYAGSRHQMSPITLGEHETREVQFHFLTEDTRLEASVSNNGVLQRDIRCWLEYSYPSGIVEHAETRTNYEGMLILEGMPSGAATLVVMPPGVTNPNEAVRLDLDIALGTVTTAECAY